MVVRWSGGVVRWRWRKATSRACASGIRLLMVLSVVGALIALAPSCSPVQYAALTAKQSSSECARVDPAALRWLLVHVTFDSTLGFPGEGPPKKGLVRSLSRTAH